MHILQEKLLNLSKKEDLGGMSLRRIGGLIGENSAQKIKHHLLQLEKKGFISMNREQGILRETMSNFSNDSKLVALPVLGCADCGEATQFADDRVQEILKVSKKLLPNRGNLFAVKAVGHSMNKAKINSKTLEDGDYAIVDGDSKNPESGNYVLSVVDGVANIKKYLEDKVNNQIVLISESTKNYPNFYIHPDEVGSFVVSGKVVDVIKRPKIIL